MFASKLLGSQSECISNYHFHIKPYLLLSMILQTSDSASACIPLPYAVGERKAKCHFLGLCVCL